MQHILLIAIILLATTACHKQYVRKKSTADTTRFENTNAQKFVQNYNRQLPQVTHFQAKAKIEYQTDKENITANLTIRSRYDSVLWVSIMPLLGVEAARIKITQDTLYVLDKIHHTVTISPIRKIEEKLGAKISLKELQDVLLGLTRIPEKIQAYKQDKNFYFISAWHEDLNYTFEIDKQKLLYSLFLKEKHTSYTSHFHYQDYADTPLQNQTVKLPYRIAALLQSKQKVQASLTYTKINLNPEKLNIPFEFSKNFKILYE
ncbi:MAG: DUF4292 domain-containing protein [Bacteroidia bacterium]|nr:DUF4292 domain-containing protein [Bacteroidia bacterium]